MRQTLPFIACIVIGGVAFFLGPVVPVGVAMGGMAGSGFFFQSSAVDGLITPYTSGVDVSFTSTEGWNWSENTATISQKRFKKLLAAIQVKGQVSTFNGWNGKERRLVKRGVIFNLQP